MLATDHDPKRVVTILNLTVQLKNMPKEKTDEKEKC
jgi:hypothetical protein